MNESPPRLADASWVPPFLTSAEVLYTDLDGTLLGRGGSLLTDAEGRPDATAAKAVAMVNAAGLPVVMVSGRNVKQLLEATRLLGWRDFIAEVGTVRVHDRGAEVHYELGDWTPGLLDETDETPFEIILRSGAIDALFAAFPGKLEYHTPYQADRLVTHILRGQVDIVAAQGILDSFTLPIAIVDNGVIHPKTHTLEGVSRVHAYHVMPKGVTKVHAIIADLEERGLAADQAMAVGDSVTDLGMAPAVGLLALVRNAFDHPGVAELAPAIENLVVTDEAAGRGWAELAEAWVSAREGHLLEAERGASARLTNVVDSMTDGFVSLDREWRYTLVNPPAERYLGRPASELLGRKVADLFPNAAFPEYRRVMETREAESFELFRPDLGGWFEIHAFPTADGISILFADISERKRSEALTQARLHLFEAVSAGETSVDELTRLVLDEVESVTASKIAFYHFVDADQQTLRLQNWSTNTVATMCSAEGKDSHYPVSQAGVWADAVREAKPVIHNDYLSLKGRKGLPEGHAPVSRELVVPILRGGRVVAVIGVGDKASDYGDTDVADVSYLGDLSWEIVERAVAEQALAESRAHADELAEMLEASSQPFGVGGPNGELLLYNHAFEELTGYTGEELSTLDWAATLTPPEYRELEAEKLAELVRTGKPVRYEKEYVRKDGSRVPIELLVGIRYDDGGRPEQYYSFLTDLTGRKAAEAALRASEDRVRRKLEAILTPEGDIGELALADLIDAPAVQAMMEDFYELASIPSAVIDLEGDVLVGVGWQPVCTQFHRVNPETCKYCIESDVELTANVPAGEAKLYRCKNGMWDMASPIFVGGKHLGNVFTGQFFLEDEVVDHDFFRAQAKRYGFDEKAYLAALAAVPRLSREKVDTGMDFLLRFADMLSKLGYSQARLAHGIAERELTADRIRQQAAVMEAVGEILQAALSAPGEQELGEVCLDAAQRITGSAIGFIDEIGPDGLLHDIALSNPGWDACHLYDKTGHRRPPGDFKVRGLYGMVFAEARPFFTNDPATEPESIGTPSGHPPLESFLGVPLFSGGKPWGVINVANKPGGYDDTDIAALEAVAPVVVEAFQRKRAERESAIAKERLDLHIDNSPLAVVEFDDRFRITRWSDEAQRMFGWSAEEVMGKAIGDFEWVYEEDSMLVDQESRNLLSAETPRSLNTNRNYRKDGTVIWCEWYDSAIYDDEGKLVSVLSQVLDITERKRAEEELARTTRRLEVLAESARLLLTTDAPDAVVQAIAEDVMTFLDCHVFFNYLVEPGESAMRLNAYAGITEREAKRIEHLGLGQAVCGCVARDGRRIVAEDVQNTQDERTDLVRSFGVQAYACHPLLYQDKTIGTLSFGTKTRKRFERDELELMRIVADQAATAMARKMAEDSLRTSEQRFRELFVNMLDGFAYCRMIRDAAGKPVDFEYVDVNAAFAAITGLHDVAGKRVTEVVPGIAESNPELFEIYGRVAAGGEPERFETEVEQLGLWFSIGVFCPEPEHFVAVFEDVTEQKERERLDEALSVIRTSVGSTLQVDEIVHEVGTRAAEALRAESMMILGRHGAQWVVTDAHGPVAGIGQALTDEDLPLAAAAVAERRPVTETDTGRGGGRRRSGMRRFGTQAVLLVPLLAQGRGIGAVGFGRITEQRPFSDLEMYFATRLTSVAALALDNALAYERERAIADTLQEAVLAPPPRIPGIETASLYRAASAEAAVGGDFYDVFPIDGGRVGIVVGDVSGKGLEAARLTSLVRDGIRAYSLERDDPPWVLARVNSLVYRFSEVESFATLFFGVLDVLSGRLCYTAAGHPPAVVCGLTPPRFLEPTPAALVGAFERAEFSVRETRLDPDEVLVLYTDGIVEARGKTGMYGEQRLLDALARLAGTPLGLLPQALLDDVLAFTEGSLRDDTVLVCVKRALRQERA